MNWNKPKEIIAASYRLDAATRVKQARDLLSTFSSLPEVAFILKCLVVAEHKLSSSPDDRG